jgi:peptidylprolyl isomerase
MAGAALLKGAKAAEIVAWVALLLSALVWACGDSPTSPAPTPVESAALRDTITASGLRFIDLVRGIGPAPRTGDVVEVHYTGQFEDGRVFDSTLDTLGQPVREPLQFVLGRGYVIAGWDEGIALMRQGGKARLVIPPALAYGERGYPDVIPPNATLTFEVELVRVR